MTATSPVTDRPESKDIPALQPARHAQTGRSLLRGGLPIVAFLLLWEFGPLLMSPSGRVFLPQFHVVVGAWWSMLLDGVIWQHFQASLLRSLIGFAIATVAGVALGLVIGWYRPVAEALNPLLEIFRNTAALALLPVFTLLLGIGELSKVSIVIFAAFFPVLLNTIAGVRSVDPLLIRAGRSLGLSQVQMFRHIVLPAAVPTTFTGIRMAGAASILVLIAAEMVGAQAGLGFLITSAQNSFLIPDMYAGLVTISLLGLLVNAGLLRVERHFSRWQDGER
ncbi:ABC transporter permease [Kocuria coralli]|uniref:ABC transporter permease n=1 Tax=Kocuria coralli TaxID=1461025 RepID=A0A5J5KXU8_9MICC|nr:ABC transporter permease [Kocuria coralli]KAA9394248.1 ABC transporter permease [Kocuria coralli]